MTKKPLRSNEAFNNLIASAKDTFNAVVDDIKDFVTEPENIIVNFPKGIESHPNASYQVIFEEEIYVLKNGDAVKAPTVRQALIKAAILKLNDAIRKESI